MLWRIAWRNVLRTRGKTAVSVILVMLSTMILGTFMSVIAGTFNKMYDNAVDIYPGSIQVSTPAYPATPHFDHLLENATALETALSKEEPIAVATARMESFFLFASDENSVGAMLVGVHPSAEEKSVRLAKGIIAGRYLLDTDTRGVVLGAALAKKLGISVGMEFSIIGSALDGSFAAETLTVVGIFQTGIDTVDQSLAHIHRDYLDALIGTQDRASYIILTPKEKSRSFEVAARLHAAYGTPEIQIVDWHTHLQSMIEGLELVRLSRYILVYFFIAIIFAVIAIFAMLIIFARKKEVGVMRALGTTPSQIVSILLIERLIITLGGIVIGVIIAAFLSHWLYVSPITIEGMADMTNRIGIMEFVFIAQFSWAILMEAAAIILVLSAVSVLYPVLSISRLKPIEAMSHT